VSTCVASGLIVDTTRNVNIKIGGGGADAPCNPCRLRDNAWVGDRQRKEENVQKCIQMGINRLIIIYRSCRFRLARSHLAMKPSSRQCGQRHRWKPRPGGELARLPKSCEVRWRESSAIASRCTGVVLRPRFLIPEQQEAIRGLTLGLPNPAQEGEVRERPLEMLEPFDPGVYPGAAQYGTHIHVARAGISRLRLRSFESDLPWQEAPSGADYGPVGPQRLRAVMTDG
jgi:hypothetical protein